MNDRKRKKGIQEWTSVQESNELYEELLNRYERILVFAGQLQEKLQQQKLLAEKNESIVEENKRLKRMLSVEQSYIQILENGLEALGVLNPGPLKKNR